MRDLVRGIHHVSTMTRDPGVTNGFAREILGLRRLKKTVSFDEPSVYHLYYGDETGTPGSIMTYFPFPRIIRGVPGTGEVGETAFAVPEESLGFWQARLAESGATGIAAETRLGESRLRFFAPHGEAFALVETPGDPRVPFTGGPVEADHAIRGFSGATLRLADGGGMEELLAGFGYARSGAEGTLVRYVRPEGNGADTIDLRILPAMPRAREGAGSVHHIAFSVATPDDQEAMRQTLVAQGLEVTPALDRNYFSSIYFRAPGGVLFEIATEGPGFTRDEDVSALGTGLKLPEWFEPRRAEIEARLPDL